jgi:hypothetical protein
MSGNQGLLELATWTAPEIMERAVGEVGNRLLNVTVNTENGREFGGPSVGPYSALTIAIECASQWRSLTVLSLPRARLIGGLSLHRLPVLQQWEVSRE